MWQEVQEEELHDLYQWVDTVPLSRPKRNIARDFSDGVMCAEVVAHFEPRLVELHNYVPANASTHKMHNWETLNKKVFRKLNFQLKREEMERVVHCEPGAIERVLKLLRRKMDRYRELKKERRNQEHHGNPSHPSAPNLTAASRSRTPAHGQDHSATGTTPPSPSTNGGAASLASHGSQGEHLTYEQLKASNQLLERKVHKLEQLVRLKDAKIQELLSRLQDAGLS